MLAEKTTGTSLNPDSVKEAKRPWEVEKAELVKARDDATSQAKAGLLTHLPDNLPFTFCD